MAGNKINKPTYSFKKILTGSDLSSRRIPMMELHGSASGPTVWLTGGMHGEEVGGVVVIQEIFKRLRKEQLLKGTLYSFPLMNPIGFENATRYLPMTKEDLNRSFPGKKDGMLAERIAKVIFDNIIKTKPDLVIDLHNDWTQSIPYTLIDPQNIFPKNSSAYQETKKIAKQSGFLVVEEREEDYGGNHNLLRSLSGSMTAAGVPALTIELGEAYVVNEKNVEAGVSAIKNILSHLEMIAPVDYYQFPLARELSNKILKYSDEPVSPASGIARFLVKPGDVVQADQPVAKIYNVFGRLEETLKAKSTAVVLGHADYSVAYPGTPILAFGVE